MRNVLGKRQTREASLSEVTLDETGQTLTLAFSSEEPVERWFGKEVLSHREGAARLQRLNDAGPLLLCHDPEKQIGVIEKAWIGEDKKGRAVVRFSRSSLAQDVLQDVKDGIRKHISVGYVVHKFELAEKRDDGNIYRADEWEGLEISIVPIPADPTVGVGRSITVGESSMDRDTVIAEERKRVQEITALCRQWNCPDLAESAIREGLGLDAVREKILSRGAAPAPAAPGFSAESLGLTDEEIKGFSFVRAIRAAADGDWSKAGFEREVSVATAKAAGKECTPNGLVIPTNVGGKRAVTSLGENPTTSSLVGTDLLANSFIEILRNRLVIVKAGATMLSGLRGNVTIPSQKEGATAYWVERGKPVQQQDVRTGIITLSPKTVGAYTDIYRDMLQQSTPQAEKIVREDLTYAVARAIDLAAIMGKGGAEPKGMMSYEERRMPIVGAATAFDQKTLWANIVKLETMVTEANADLGNLTYVTNAKVRGLLKSVERFEKTGQVIWQNGASSDEGVLNGYRALVSNQIPANLGANKNMSALLFFRAAEMILGEWGILDIQVNPYALSESGGLRLRILQDVDIAHRHTESFSFWDGIVT